MIGHVEIRNKKETRNKEKEKNREKENKIGKSIFLTEIREVFKKEERIKDSKDKIYKNEKSDLDQIFLLIFNRFKVLKEEKSQISNKDSTKTNRFDKKNEKNLSVKTKIESTNRVDSQNKDSNN